MKDVETKSEDLQTSNRQFGQFGWLLMLVVLLPEWITMLVAIWIVAIFDVPENKTLAVFVIVAISLFVIFLYVVLYLMAWKVRKALRTSGWSGAHLD